jgi:CHASE2 domain-containing sensor protein
MLVMIGDKEFYSRELARRNPLKRDYLARLVTAIDQAEARVIALDMDFGVRNYREYEKETEKLRAALAGVRPQATIVLTAAVSGGPREYDRHEGLFDKLRHPNLRFGYAALTKDLRQSGMRVPLKGGGDLDSFATVIASAVDPRTVEDLRKRLNGGFPYVSFLRPEQIDSVSAASVIGGDREALKKLAFKTVIVGGNWHRNGVGSGPRVDQYDTPFGMMSGAMLHANYVEALLARATKKPVSGAFNIIVDILATLGVALVFAIAGRALHVGLGLAVIGLATIVASLVIWQNLGGFFDSSVVVAFVLVHAFIERRHTSHGDVPRVLSVRGIATLCLIAASLIGLSREFEPAALIDPAMVAWVASLVRVYDVSPPLDVPAALPMLTQTLVVENTITTAAVREGGPVVARLTHGLPRRASRFTPMRVAPDVEVVDAIAHYEQRESDVACTPFVSLPMAASRFSLSTPTVACLPPASEQNAEGAIVESITVTAEAPLVEMPSRSSIDWSRDLISNTITPSIMGTWTTSNSTGINRMSGSTTSNVGMNTSSTFAPPSASPPPPP